MLSSTAMASLVHTVYAHNTIKCQTVNADSAFFVIPANADFLYIWDLATKTPEKVKFGAHVQQQELTAGCWSSDGGTIAVGSSKGAMVIFDIATRKIKHNLQGVHERVCQHEQAHLITRVVILDICMDLELQACNVILRIQPLKHCTLLLRHCNALLALSAIP